VSRATGCGLVTSDSLVAALNMDRGLESVLALEVPNCSNIEIGKNSVGFVLAARNAKINNGIRSEVAIGYPFNEEDTVEYSWSIKVPAKSNLGAEGRWWVIAQWHDQPDSRLNESWANFKAQSPPVAIYVEKRDSIIGIGVQGVGGRKLSWAPIPIDEWLNIRAIIHWSRAESGSVKFSVVDHPSLNFEYTGLNMLNSYQHYFKLGQYRDPTVQSYSVLYIKDVKISTLSSSGADQ
jgi:hypothetical protein